MLFLVSNVYPIFLSFPLLLFVPEKSGQAMIQKVTKKSSEMILLPTRPTLARHFASHPIPFRKRVGSRNKGF